MDDYSERRPRTVRPPMPNRSPGSTSRTTCSVALVRSDLRERGLIGRGTFILLFNSAGELCVHRRTLSKALYPGLLGRGGGRHGAGR